MTQATNDSVQHRAIETTRAVLTSLFERNGKRDFAVRLWDDQVLPATGSLPSRFTLVLTHPGVLRRMFFPPGEPTLGETYLRGDFDIEGDMIAAASLGPSTTVILTPSNSPQSWVPILALVWLDWRIVLRRNEPGAEWKGGEY
jgi:hypothetical protein